MMAMSVGLASSAAAADTGPGSYYNRSGYGGFGNNGNTGNYRSGGYAPVYRNRVYRAVDYPRYGNDGGFYRSRSSRQSRGLNTVPHYRNSHEPRVRHFIHGADMAY